MADAGEAQAAAEGAVPGLERIQELIAEAKRIRVEGNGFYARQQYEEASSKYSDAIAVLAEPHRLLVSERLRADKARKDAAEQAKREREEQLKQQAAQDTTVAGADKHEEQQSDDKKQEQKKEEKEEEKEEKEEEEEEESEEKRREKMVGAELSLAYGNRAACRLGQKQWQATVDDCTAALAADKGNKKAYWRRADAREELHKYREALEDLRELCKLDAEIARQAMVRQAVARLEPLAKKQQEEELREVLGKLKQFGNMVLGKFGLSTDDFKVEKDPQSGGYSLKFAKQPPPQHGSDAADE